MGIDDAVPCKRDCTENPITKEIITMRNIFKKAAALTMAVALLGAGSSYATDARVADNTAITASAYDYMCGQFVCNGHYEWKYPPIYETIGNKKTLVGYCSDKYWVTECCVCHKKFWNFISRTKTYY